MIKYTIGKRLTDKTANELNWQEIDIDKYKIKTPIILCLSGNGTITPKAANGIAKMVQNLIGAENQVDILGVQYSHSEHSRMGTLTSEDVDEIVKALILPLVQKDGKRLPIEQAKKNFRKINIFSHCHGATVVMRLNNKIKSCLDDLGYNFTESLLLLEQIFNVSYVPEYSDVRNSSFMVKSLNDSLSGKNYKQEIQDDDLDEAYKKSLDTTKLSKEYLSLISKKYIKNKGSFVGCGFIKKTGNAIDLYVTKVSPMGIDDHFIANVRRSEQWQIQNSTDSLHADVASQCMAYALAMSVANSLQNNETDIFIPLNMEQIREDCYNIVMHANNSDNEKENFRRFIALRAVYPIYEVMEKNAVTEKDLVCGKCSLFDLQCKQSGQIDYTGTIFEEIKTHKTESLLCYCEEYIKRQPTKLSKLKHKYGLILPNGIVSTCNSKNELMMTCMNKQIFQMTSLKDSIKFEIKDKDGKYVMILSDNYGSKQISHANTIRELLDIWQKIYNNNILTINLTEKQKIAVVNYCATFGIKCPFSQEQSIETSTQI